MYNHSSPFSNFISFQLVIKHSVEVKGLRLIGMTKCAREIKISEKYLAFFKETV
jgi:hypothetical protein